MILQQFSGSLLSIEETGTLGLFFQAHDFCPLIINKFFESCKYVWKFYKKMCQIWKGVVFLI